MPRVTLGPFSIETSEDWTLSSVILAGPPPPEQRSRGALAGHAGRAFRANLVATMERVEADDTPSAYLERQAEGLRQAGVAVRRDADPGVVTLAGELRGLQIEQVIAGPQGERVRQLTLMAKKGDVMFTLIWSNLDGQPFDDSRAEFEAMLRSFV